MSLGSGPKQRGPHNLADRRRVAKWAGRRRAAKPVGRRRAAKPVGRRRAAGPVGLGRAEVFGRLLIYLFILEVGYEVSSHYRQMTHEAGAGAEAESDEGRGHEAGARGSSTQGTTPIPRGV